MHNDPVPDPTFQAVETESTSTDHHYPHSDESNGFMVRRQLVNNVFNV